MNHQPLAFGLAGLLLLSGCSGGSAAQESSAAPAPSSAPAGASSSSHSSSAPTPESLPSSSDSPASSSAAAQPLPQVLPPITFRVLDREGTPLDNVQLSVFKDGEMLTSEFLNADGEQVWNENKEWNGGGNAVEGAYTFTVGLIDEDGFAKTLIAAELRENPVVEFRLDRVFSRSPREGFVPLTFLDKDTGEPIRNIWIVSSDENGEYQDGGPTDSRFTDRNGNFYKKIYAPGLYFLVLCKDAHSVNIRYNMICQMTVDDPDTFEGYTFEVDVAAMEERLSQFPFSPNGEPANPAG